MLHQCSGHFVKSEQWERRRAKRKLMSWFQVWGRRYHPRQTFDFVSAKSYNAVHLGSKTVRIAVHSAFLDTLKQWERRSHAFRQLFNNGNMCFPSKCFALIIWGSVTDEHHVIIIWCRHDAGWLKSCQEREREREIVSRH